MTAGRSTVFRDFEGWGTMALVTTKVSKVIRAPREAIYRACTRAEALATWRVPDAMTARVHEFDLREGGWYRMSLTYEDPRGAPGKSTADTDTFRGRFIRLVEGEKIVEQIVFDSPDPRFSGTMRMTTTLAGAGAGSTEVTVTCENLPAGIRPEDNEEGTRQALEKLARYVEADAGG